VILAQTIKAVRVYIMDEKTGKLLKGKKTIYEGQHVLTFDEGQK
jgi:hypothetical protein